MVALNKLIVDAHLRGVAAEYNRHLRGMHSASSEELGEIYKVEGMWEVVGSYNEVD